MPEELRFEMDYKGETHGFHYKLDSASEQDVAHAAASVSGIANEKGFLYSGVNLSRVDSFIGGLGGEGISGTLTGLAPGELRNCLKDACGEKEKLVPAAEAYFFHRLLGKHSLPCVAEPGMFGGRLIMEKTHPKGRIALMAKYKSWVAIKKMSVGPGVRDYEVSGILCAINETLVRKAFEFARIDTAALDTHAKKLAAGRRKSPSVVGEVLESLPEKGKTRVENAYLVFALLGEFGLKPYASREMLSKQYPDVKPPKPRGRMPKG